MLYESDKYDIINQYIIFCKVFNEQTKQHGTKQNAVTETIRICKDRNVLWEYLRIGKGTWNSNVNHVLFTFKRKNMSENIQTTVTGQVIHFSDSSIDNNNLLCYFIFSNDMSIVDMSREDISTINSQEGKGEKIWMKI